MLNRIRQSLSNKLTIAIMLLAVPVFLIAMDVMYRQSRYFIRTKAMDNASSVLNTTVQRVRTDMTTIEIATDVNKWMAEENFQPDMLQNLTRRIVMLNRHVNGCSITAVPDAFPQYGRNFSVYTIHEGDSIITGQDKDTDYYEKAWYNTPRKEDKACWMAPSEDNNKGKLSSKEITLSYNEPLYGKDGQFIGIISCDVALQKLIETIDSAAYPYPHAFYALVGNNGQFIIHPDTSKILKSTIFSDVDPRWQADMIALGHEMTEGNQGSIVVNIDDSPCLVSYQPIPATEWSLALVCPDSDILQSYYKLTNIVFAVIIIGLIIILILCNRAVAHAIRPISQLLGKLQRIANEEYDTHIPMTNRVDAVGRLQNSFATMLQTLNFHMGSIRYTLEQTQRRNEEIEKATRKAEEAVKHKTLFIQNVTHQIRTPLNIINGFAQVLRDSAKNGDNNKTSLTEQELLEITSAMGHNAFILKHMVQMLFDSSETGFSEEAKNYRKEPVSCNEAVRACFDYVKKVVPEMEARFETELPDDFTISTDKTFLGRTLGELFHNAAKYSDGKHILIRAIQTENTVCFIVEDIGPGLPDNYREQVFEPFTKANDLSEGLGLGLPLARHHAIGLGGSLTLDANYHEGCRFILELPK